MRGIMAVTSIFIAAQADDEIKLGEWISGGLFDAISDARLLEGPRRPERDGA